MLPNFLLIGPGRSGSDWVTRNLSLHPEVFMPRRKSTRYFSHNYDNGLDWYESIFKTRDEIAVGEASVGYLHNESAPKRIYDTLPNIKLIATLRNPADRAYSEFGRLAGVAQKDEINYDISFEEKIKLSPKLIENGKYGGLIKRYLELFPQENMLILFFDDMLNNPIEYLKSIYLFLGVNSDFVSPVIHQKLNATSTLSSKSKSLYFLYRALLRLNQFNLAKKLDRGIKKEKKPMNLETRKWLVEEFYHDDFLELEKLTGRDLSSWRIVK